MPDDLNDTHLNCFNVKVREKGRGRRMKKGGTAKIK
jgi:hypothetical protein